MQITNPGIFSSGKKESLRAPTVFNMGFGLQVSEQVYTGLEIKKEEGRSMQSVFALQYWPHDKIVTKLGWSTGNNQPYFTIGWMLNQFSIETGCSYHAALGITPSVSFIYSNIKKENIE